MKPLGRLLPQPLLSFTLVVVWMLLVNQFSLNHLALAIVLGIVIPWFSYRFWPYPPLVHRPILLLRYVVRVIGDIIIANIEVAILILSKADAIRPRFVRFPLELSNEFAITMLANTITLTPGTVTADVSEDRSWLLIHGLDVSDEQALIEKIRRRYERPLREIFES